MNSDFSKEITQLQEEIKKIKASQVTMADSTNIYTVSYDPGYFALPDGRSGVRYHTIICHALNNVESAVFMAEFQSDPAMQSISGGGRLPTYEDNMIGWIQYNSNEAYLPNPAYAALEPRAMTIYSNVDFYITTSYVDVIY